MVKTTANYQPVCSNEASESGIGRETGVAEPHPASSQAGSGKGVPTGPLQCPGGRQKKSCSESFREPSPNTALGETIAQDRGQTACGPTRSTCLCRACLFLIAKPRPHGHLSFQYCESFESFSFNRLWHDPTQHFPIFSLLGWETVLYIINFPFLKNLGYFLQCASKIPATNHDWGVKFTSIPL